MNEYWDKLKESVDGFYNDLNKGDAKEDDVKSYTNKKAELIGYTSKPSFLTQHAPGQYIRNDDTIIISAPNIIIGNVDVYGNVIGDGTVTLRSSSINLEGTGKNGTGEIVSRAATIKNIAEHPGADGNENSVGNTSKILLQARDVSMVSQNGIGRFSIDSNSDMGIHILSDSYVKIDAAAPTDKKRKGILDTELQEIKKEKTSHVAALKRAKKAMDDTYTELRDVLNDSSDKRSDGKPIDGNIYLLDELHRKLETITTNFATSLKNYVDAASDVAKDNFNIVYLQSQIDTFKNVNKSDKKKSTQAYVSINGETLVFSNDDETGELRTNPGAGTVFSAPRFQVHAQENGTIVDGSEVNIQVEKIVLDTTKTQYTDKKKGEGSCISQGEVDIYTKSLNVESIDYDIKDFKKKEKQLSEDSTINVRTEGVTIDTSQKEKANGFCCVNSKVINLTGCDLKGKKYQIADSSNINIAAKKVRIGKSPSGPHSESVQILSKKANVIGIDTATIGMGSKGTNAEISLSENKISIVGQSLESSASTNTFNEVAVTKKFTAPEAEINNAKIQGTFDAGAINNNGIKVPNTKQPVNCKAKAEAEVNDTKLQLNKQTQEDKPVQKPINYEYHDGDK